ncbi:MAG: type II toxin-antitoxin system death-on-curing family toxin [Actinobacteria bacterium HGW-Actinobacteria-7]|nr:MAG: type II toxin-antitoxin system death-on-curing family toxin [Actinobacteria bacterium HGW-Actinobacteria-7]
MAGSTPEPRWLHRLVVDAIHHDSISTHGGLPGLRDEKLLESALERPKQAFAHGSGVDIAALAAAYAYGIARNHPYHDGNKRIAFMTMAVFAELNGYEFEVAETDVVHVMLRLAAGDREEEGRLAEWLRARLVEIGD